MADDHGQPILITPDGVLRHTVKIGRDHNVVSRMAEDGGQHHVARAGVLVVHFLLQIEVALPGILKHFGEIRPIEAAPVLPGNAQAVLPALMLRRVLLAQLLFPELHQLLACLDAGGFGGARAEHEAVFIRILPLLGVRLLGQLPREVDKTQFSVTDRVLFHIRPSSPAAIAAALLPCVYHIPKRPDCQPFSTARTAPGSVNRGPLRFDHFSSRSRKSSSCSVTLTA